MKGSLLQAACVIVPKGLGGVLTVVLNAVLITRMSPEEFGVYALCLVLIALFDGVLGSAIDMSAIKLSTTGQQSEARSSSMQFWALSIKLALLVTIFCVAFFFATPTSVVLFHRVAPDLLLLAILNAGGVLMFRSQMLRFQLRNQFFAYAAFDLLAQFMRVTAVFVVVVWMKPSAEALVQASLVGAVVTVLAGLLLGGFGWTKVPVVTRDDGREMLRSLRWILIIFTFSALISRVDIFLLTRWSSIQQVGFFAAAQVYAQIPELLGLCLSVVFSQRVLPSAIAGRLRLHMRRLHRWLLGASVFVLLLAAVVVHYSNQILPSGYSGSTEIFVPLLIGSLAGMIAMPLTVPYIMFTHPRHIFAYDALTLPLLLLAYYWAINTWGGLGAAWVSACARVIKCCVFQLFVNHWLTSAPQSSTLHGAPG